MKFSAEDVRMHLQGLTKPAGSLGRLEDLAMSLCVAQQTHSPRTSPRRLVIFAADHGVAKAGVTLWSSAVTNLMLVNMCQGGAASTVFARQFQADAVLVNVGTLDDPISESMPSANGICYRSRRIRAGTRNLAAEPAMTVDEFHQAWNVGVDEARIAARDEIRIVIGGEMGIGNTTPASCLAMLLADVPLEKAVGPGAGATDETLARKRLVVESAVARARREFQVELVTAIAAVAGFEIVALAGFFFEAAQQGMTILLDGLIASSAALIAQSQWPEVTRSLIAAHRSSEPAHGLILDHLHLNPYLEWNLRLGEGTGALLLLPLVDAAAAMTTQMDTLASFGIIPRAEA